MAIMKRKKLTAKPGLPPQSNKVISDNITPHGLIQLARDNDICVTPLDLNSLVKVLGIGLRIMPMNDQKSGYIKKEEGRWVIGVNSLHHPNRQRFTIAHELGHYSLHRDQIGDGLEDSILFRADGYGAEGIEREANIFASEMLMPEGYFREVVDEHGGDIKSIAKALQVSSLAVSIRAKNLGYKASK